MKQSFTTETLTPILSQLKTANTEFTSGYPGLGPERQPVHTVYGGAQIFNRGVAKKMGEAALKTMATYASDGQTLAYALGQSAASEELWTLVHKRVTEKLKSEAVEDFRIDFEDGYGNRPDAEEDGHAESTAQEVAAGMKEGSSAVYRNSH
jgi:hypothetical protein